MLLRAVLNQHAVYNILSNNMITDEMLKVILIN